MPTVTHPASLSSQFRDDHILIIGLNYWPEESGNAPYTTGLAEDLAARGASVTVVTGMPYYPQWKVFDGYRGHTRLRENIRGVDVVRFRQFVPERQSALHRALFESTFFLNALRSLRLPRPDVVLGVVPSLAGGALAGLAARRYGVPHGLIIQDLVGQAAAQSGIRGGGRVAKVTRALEARIARQATGVAIVSEGFRDHLKSMGVAPNRMVHLPNWAHIAPAKLPRAMVRDRLGWAPETQVVLHAGNMGLKQGLEQVVTAARVAQVVHPAARFVLMGDGNQRPALEKLAAGLENVTFLDPQPADWFPEMLHAADALLVSQRSSVTDMSLPSKLTSYFMAGRPVVAAVSESSATATAMSRSGGGIVVPADDPAALVAALNRLATDDGLTARLGLAGRAFAEQNLGPKECLARAGLFVSGLLGKSLPAERANPLQGEVA